MRVCDVVLNSIWYDPRVRRQISEYKNKGVDLSCVGLKCSRFDKSEILKIPCRTKIVMINSKYDSKQRFLYKKLLRTIMQIKNVQKAILKEQPDLIHANDLNALIPAYIASKRLGCRIVYDSHEVSVENYTSKKKILLSWLMKITECYIIRRVDLVVCVSNAAAVYFESEYNIQKPMVVTNCALKKDICEYKLKHPGFEILNHGRFYEGRGFDLVIQACKYLREFPEIKMAIRGMGRLEDGLRKMATIENAGNCVFYPSVRVEELIPKAAMSMVGIAITEPICLNFKLSVSNKLFEYVAAGLPVIMSDIPEHRYLNNKYNIGIVLAENSSKALAEAVIRFYMDKTLYDKCAFNAKKMATELNWENEFKKLLDYEDELIESNI